MRKKLRKGGGDFWKRQFEGDGFGLGGGISDGGYYEGGGFGGDFGGFDGGLYDGGIGYFGGEQGQTGESSLGELPPSCLLFSFSCGVVTDPYLSLI